MQSRSCTNNLQRTEKLDLRICDKIIFLRCKFCLWSKCICKIQSCHQQSTVSELMSILRGISLYFDILLLEVKPAKECHGKYTFTTGSIYTAISLKFSFNSKSNVHRCRFSYFAFETSADINKRCRMQRFINYTVISINY